MQYVPFFSNRNIATYLIGTDEVKAFLKVICELLFGDFLHTPVSKLSSYLPPDECVSDDWVDFERALHPHEHACLTFELTQALLWYTNVRPTFLL